ncbi:hypothetical protein EDB81DRAFT_913002 [Dactylonectria macrodidyma]|uniref:chitinase n=1 Tax=Dactylonectria macrodidyma TaxID=307937 RepID=A0A9P9DNX4_9HYPO|nr:hypothetical protein EDB81DRAFT_913002 [Dactylonectria macrodidyma]
MNVRASLNSYDIHGTWDKGNEWNGAYLNAHTNLTEITDALDLLWRNNVSPDNVVLDSTNAKSILYEDAAVKVLNYEDDQWVAYDDEDTFKLRADFARGQCLGGLMVWAISHDTKHAKYTRALVEAANRKIIVPVPVSREDLLKTKGKCSQCKWTYCGEQCPSGWLRVARRDGGERETEYMIDEQGCNGISHHQLCCPPGDDVPTYGWYNRNNRNCDGSRDSFDKQMGTQKSLANTDDGREQRKYYHHDHFDNQKWTDCECYGHLEDEGLDDALRIFLESFLCIDDAQSNRYNSQEIAIAARFNILYSTVSSSTVEAWDKRVGAKNQHLKYNPSGLGRRGMTMLGKLALSGYPSPSFARCRTRTIYSAVVLS